ncbi:hypothetical protein S83_034260 [Arachis hypogaea]
MLLLYEVNLERNSFEGSIPDLSNCTPLQYLLLVNNRLIGVVPPYWLQDPLPSFNKTQTSKEISLLMHSVQTILDLVITESPLCFKLLRHFIIHFRWRNHGEETITNKLGISSPVMIKATLEP